MPLDMPDIPPDNPETVLLTREFRVPRTFTCFGTPDRLPDPSSPVVRFDVEMIGSEPLVRALYVYAPEGASPLRIGDIADLPWAQMFDRFVSYEALGYSDAPEDSPVFPTDRPRTPEAIDQWMAALRSREAAAESAVHRARTRRRITPEMLTAVLKAHEAGGIQQVMALGDGYSERNARRLLARARKELGQ